MLKNIIFIMEARDRLWSVAIRRELERIRRKLKKNEVMVSTRICTKESAADWVKRYQAMADGSESLFVTDVGEVMDACRQAGCYAIAYLHAENPNMWQALYAIQNVGELEYESFEQAYQRLAGLPWHIADTKRLVIRETTQEDIKAFYDIYEDPSITFYMENLYDDIEREREYMQTYIEKIYGFYGYGIWTLLLKDNGTVIGRAGLSWREGYSIPELGFVIGTQYQKKGYGFEACEKILELAKTEYEFEQVQALVENQNEPSKQLLYKLGFTGQTVIRENSKEYILFVKKV